MRRYADPERCPDCLTAMPYGSTRCPSCGLLLEGPLASELFTTLTHADDLLAVLRQPAGTPAAPPAPVTATPATTRSSGAGGLATLARPTVQQPPAGGPPPHRPHRPRGGLAGASVPKILLGLGALCLLVAALVFLAVTWSALGVAGRTVVLLVFTAVTGVLTSWAARRDLRAAAESLVVVTLGLLAFDLVGAGSAGWLGDPDTAELLVLLGTVLAAVGATAALAVRRTPVGALVAAEVVAAAGLAGAAAGMVGTDWFAWSAGLTLAVLVAAAAAFAANAVRLDVLAVGSAMAALASWMVLAVAGWDRALQHPSWSQLWADLEVWPLLVAAGLATGLVAVRGLPSAVRLAALGVGALLLGAAVLAPFADEAATWRMLAAAVLVVAVAALALVTPPPWRRSLAVPGSVGLLWVATVAVGLASEGTVRLLRTGAARWQGTAGDALPARVVDPWTLQGWLLPVLVVAAGTALVAAARSFRRADQVVAPLADFDLLLAVAAGTAALTLALHPVPVWLVLAVLLASGSGLVVRWSRRREALPLVLAAGFVALGTQLSLHAEPLTLVACSVALVAAGCVYLRSAWIEVSVGAGVLLSSALAGVAWTVGALSGTSPEWAASATLLALAALALGGPYLDRSLLVSSPAGLARLGVELGALAAAAVVGAAGVAGAAPAEEPVWAAVYLTVAGAAASAMALLRRDRRGAGWLGGLLLAAASWVRLADLGVEAPEAYTLPAALALVAVGLHHLRRPGTGTVAALSPGLALALVPSLLWAFAEPVALRSLLLGVACLALVVAGVRLRWSAPLLHGGVVGALLVLRHVTPVAEAVPRWALIGAAGVLLVAMGITWEARVRDARRVAGYVRGLR